jgi:hypothetical protein
MQTEQNKLLGLSPTERPPLVGEISQLLRIESATSRGQRDGSLGHILGFLDRSRYFWTECINKYIYK